MSSEDSRKPLIWTGSIQPGLDILALILINLFATVLTQYIHWNVLKCVLSRNECLLQVMIHSGDMPQHGSRFHEGAPSIPFDSFENCNDKDHRGLRVEDLLMSIKEKKINYFFGKITNYTDKMIKVTYTICTSIMSRASIIVTTLIDVKQIFTIFCSHCITNLEWGLKRFEKWAIPGLVFFYLCLFKKHYHFYNK